MRILKQSHSDKNVKVKSFWASWNSSLFQKIEGGPFGDKKTEKSLTTGDLLVSSGFVCYVWK